MNTTMLEANSKPNNRRTEYRKVNARNGTDRMLPLLGALLMASAAYCAPATGEATYKLFGREVGGYASKDDVPGIINKELGPRATVADWDEIKKQYGQSEAGLRAFCDKIGLAPDASDCVTVGGKRFWREQRQYFVCRADHKVPEDFMLHDQLQNNFLLLGSWVDARPVLVKIADYNATDAAKWAKWDQALKDAGSKDISGVYSLVSVDGKKVPGTISHGGHTLEVRSGTFTIARDGNCTSKLTFVPPSGVESTMEVKATSTREGAKLKMQWVGAGITTGKIEGNTFTMENEGMVFTYKK